MAGFDLTKRRIYLEIAIVLALSLGASALYSIVDLIAALTAPAGIGGHTTTLNPTLSSREWLDLTYQLLRLVLSFAPVALVFYLLSQNSNVLRTFGISRGNLGAATANGFALAAVIGIPGIGLYLLARALKLSAKVVASDLQNHWWTIAVLLLAAASAALVEETIVIGYLFERLARVGFKPTSVIFISALLRASYHLYQGFGGFIGNLVMGLVFGWIYKRNQKLLPLLIAHFLLDAFSFIGYPLVAHLLP
ncbi:MAG: CPBP family intramembrane glutamic endopeptidase [Actinomycetes bacterium]